MSTAEVENPALLVSSSRELWHVGSVVEVFSNSDSQWLVGYVRAEDTSGLLTILFGDPQNLRTKQLSRSEPHLAPLGQNLRHVPPNWSEVSAGNRPQIVHPSGRRSLSLEEAWEAHYENNIVPLLQRSYPGLPLKGSSASAFLANHYDGHVLTGGALEAVMEASRYQEDDRLEDHQKDKAQLIAELQVTREERDSARRDLSRARMEIERLQQILQGGRSVPQVTHHAASWQPTPLPSLLGAEIPEDGVIVAGDISNISALSSPQPVATAPGALLQASSSARERRASETPIEIHVSVPRAFAHDELIEEVQRKPFPVARSIGSLNQTMVPTQSYHRVSRLPSAPITSLSNITVKTTATSKAPQSTSNLRPFGQPIPFPTAPPSAPASMAAPAGGTQRVVLAAPPRQSVVIPTQSPYANYVGGPQALSAPPTFVGYPVPGRSFV